MSDNGQSQDARLSFDGAVDIYDEIRPTYPSELFDVLFSLLALSPEVVEVGPGTGQATRDLLARGAHVHAIDISPSMARKLRLNLSDERLRVSVGDFETFDLAARNTDAVFSATAYHWISPRAQLDRPAAILRPGGVVAIVDLIQVESPGDLGFFTAAQPLYERYGQGHVGPPAPSRKDVVPPMKGALAGDPRFTDVDVHCWDWDQTYTASGYRKLMLSYSGTNMMEANQREGLLDDIESFINSRFNGRVTRPLVVCLTTAKLLAARDSRL